MNRLVPAASLAVLLLAPAFAAPAAFAADASTGAATLVVACDASHRPGQRAIGDLLGIDNPREAYQARSRVMAQVRSACKRPGVVRVTVSGRVAPMLVAQK
jgi:hypothetical protein